VNDIQGTGSVLIFCGEKEKNFTTARRSRSQKEKTFAPRRH